MYDHSHIQEQLLNHPILSKEEEAELAKLIQAGDTKALHKLILSNQRFVHKWCMKYRNKGISFEDIFQYANEGMLNAARNFNPNKGRFLTIAAWHMRDVVERNLFRERSVIYLPSNVAKDMNTYFGRKKQNIETGFSKVEQEKFERLLPSHYPTSMEEEDQTEQSMHDTFGDKTTKSSHVLGHLSSLESIELAFEYLDSYDERMRPMLSYRFGLDGDVPHTLDETGEEFGYVRERIRQIEKEALKLLKEYFKNEIHLSVSEAA